MVATRHSLGSPASPPAAPTTMSKRVSKEISRLSIAGTDVLKGAAPADKPAEGGGEVYHYRGAVYAVTSDTRREWLEAQPKRYQRGREEGEGSEEAASETGGREEPHSGVKRRRPGRAAEDGEGEEGPAKRQRLGRPAAATKTTTMTKEAASRKRKAVPAEVNTSKAFDMCVVGGTDESRPKVDLEAYVADMTGVGKVRRIKEGKSEDGAAKDLKATIDKTSGVRVTKAKTTTKTTTKNTKMARAAYNPTPGEDGENKSAMIEVLKLARLLKDKELELEKARALNAFLMGGGRTESEANVVFTESGYGDGSKFGEHIRRARLEEKEFYGDAGEGKGDGGGFFEGDNITVERDAVGGAEREGEKLDAGHVQQGMVGTAREEFAQHTQTETAGVNDIRRRQADQNATPSSLHPSATSFTQNNSEVNTADTDTDIQADRTADETLLPSLIQVGDPSKPTPATVAKRLSPTIPESPPHHEEHAVAASTERAHISLSQPAVGSSSRPSTVHSAVTALSRPSPASGPNTNTRLATPTLNQSPSSAPSTATKSTSTTTPTSAASSTTFTDLRPGDPLPTHDKAGSPLRWSIEVGTDSEGKQEYLVKKGRMAGENPGRRRRRVRRELEIVYAWSRGGGGSVREVGNE